MHARSTGPYSLVTQQPLGGINFSNLYQQINQSNGDILTIGGIISALLPYLFVVAGLLLLLYLVFGGFGLLTSRGDPKAVQIAKERITFALVGFIVVFVSYWIVQIIGVVLGPLRVIELPLKKLLNPL